MKRWVGLAAICSLLVISVGCGEDTANEASGPSTTGNDEVAEVRADVEVLFGKGTHEEPATSGPKPEPGKKVALISCGQTVTACAGATAGAKEAAEAIGWRPTVFDAQYDFGRAATGVRQAIAAKADAVFVYYIDCQYLRSPLEQAKAAGIPVVGVESLDCSETEDGGPQLFSATLQYAEGSYLDWVDAWAKAQAQYAIAKLDGKANMILIADDSLEGSKRVVSSVKQTFADCSECELEVVTFPIARFGKLQSISQSALLENPKANAMMGAYESIMLSGGTAAVRSSGRELEVSIGEGTSAGMDALRSGQATYGAGLPVEWEGWAGIDALVRLLADEKPQSSGIGVQLFDEERNVPPKGGYVPPIDFRAAYRTAWGLQ